MGSRGLKTVLWGTGSIFLSLGTLALGVAGGMVAGWTLFTSEAPPPPECPPQVQCPESTARPEPCICDEPEPEPEASAQPEVRPRPRTSASPEPEPEAEPAARIVITGDTPVDLWFEQGGRVVGQGPLGPGTYDLVATVTDVPRVMGQVTVVEGQQTVTINCSRTWGKCKAVE